MIPLGKLRLSEANVRKNDSNLFIEELAANIEAKGLLQNLIVAPAKKRGIFDVTAGGRRLRALNPQALCLLTRGGQGASLFRGEQSADARAPVVDVVDTVGAGDASAAGLLHSLSRHPDRSLQAHLHAALAAGSAACLQSGATPPTPQAMTSLNSPPPRHSPSPARPCSPSPPMAVRLRVSIPW